MYVVVQRSRWMVEGRASLWVCRRTRRTGLAPVVASIVRMHVALLSDRPSSHDILQPCQSHRNHGVTVPELLEHVLGELWQDRVPPVPFSRPFSLLPPCPPHFVQDKAFRDP